MEQQNYNHEYDNERREFLKKNLWIGGLALIGTSGIISSCNNKEEKVTPTEDLMREHGLLNRILLIYDHCRSQLESGVSFSLKYLTDAAQIMKTFVEDYHEKMEENFLFPRFEKANKLTDLVKTLKAQHDAGRTITTQIINYKNTAVINKDDQQKLVSLLSSFNTMYRPHEAREDTVLFPALRKIVSAHEFASLGEDFEKKEHIMFGEDGFEMMVGKVADIEQQLGIYDLAKFTPQV